MLFGCALAHRVLPHSMTTAPKRVKNSRPIFLLSIIIFFGNHRIHGMGKLDDFQQPIHSPWCGCRDDFDMKAIELSGWNLATTIDAFHFYPPVYKRYPLVILSGKKFTVVSLCCTSSLSRNLTIVNSVIGNDRLWKKAGYVCFSHLMTFGHESTRCYDMAT